MKQSHLLSLTVEDKPGALTRIAGLFARRGFNIESLTVGPSEQEGFSRMTLTVRAEQHALEQISKQLNKLVEVTKIRELSEADSVRRQLGIYKIAAAGEKRSQAIEIINIFRAKVIDISPASITAEISGRPEKLAGFEQMLKPFGIIESMTSGHLAASRDA